jgi:hypothetical protein
MSRTLPFARPAVIPEMVKSLAFHAGLRFECLGCGVPGRDDLEAFIAGCFLRNYNARVSHFCDMLVGSRDAYGTWTAALGYSLAASGPAFLEQYLDQPLEVAIGERLGRTVVRKEIVEVGNLAALQPGAARTLIVHMTKLLHDMGLRIVAFTATASLLNSFGRLQLQPQVLAPADPARLPGAGREWATYYDTQPQVMFGDIRYGYAELARFSTRQHSTAE